MDVDSAGGRHELSSGVLCDYVSHKSSLLRKMQPSISKKHHKCLSTISTIHHHPARKPWLHLKKKRGGGEKRN